MNLGRLRKSLSLYRDAESLLFATYTGQNLIHRERGITDLLWVSLQFTCGSGFSSLVGQTSVPLWIRLQFSCGSGFSLTIRVSGLTLIPQEFGNTDFLYVLGLRSATA